jgi:TPR repeat protein
MLYWRGKEGDNDAILQLAPLTKADDDNKSAHRCLWNLLSDGNKEAGQCYLELAEEGYALAQYNVAARLRLGFGPDHGHDINKALRWAELSAAQSFARAQSFLGDLYYSDESQYNDELKHVHGEYKKTGETYYSDKETEIIKGVHQL